MSDPADQPVLDLRMMRQQVEAIRQGQRRRLVSGQEQGDHLVPELSVGNRGALPPLRGQQPGEQVTRILVPLPPPADDRVDDPIQPPHRRPEPQVQGQREPSPEAGPVERMEDMVAHDGDCRRDLGGSPVGALPELVERLARIRLQESVV